MTYPLDPLRPERYSKLVPLYIQLPDGKTITRKTDHTYKFVTVVCTPDRDDGRPATWGVLGWHHNRKNAETRMLQFRNAVSPRFPGFQWAIVTVLENEPEPLEDTSRLGEIVQNFMNAAPVEVVRPSLSYPEPVPGKTFKTVPKGRNGVLITSPIQSEMNEQQKAALEECLKFRPDPESEPDVCDICGGDPAECNPRQVDVDVFECNNSPSQRARRKGW